MNSERQRGSEAKPHFDAANPPLSELAQRAVDAAKSGDCGLLFDMAIDMIGDAPSKPVYPEPVSRGYDHLRQTFNGVAIRDLVERGEWPPTRGPDRHVDGG